MARGTPQWFLSLQMTLYLFLLLVRGNEDADDAYKNGRNLVLEYFLPINLPPAVDVPLRREKRDVEGSGEDDSAFSELNEKAVEDADNSTEKTFAKFILEEGRGKSLSDEGSGEIDEMSESSENSTEEKANVTFIVPLIGETEVFTTTQSVETTETPENLSETILESTEMIFDKSEDFGEISSEETTNEPTPAVILTNTTIHNKEELETTTLGNPQEENTTGISESRQNESTTFTSLEIMTTMPKTTTVHEETMTVPPADTTTTTPQENNNIQTIKSREETTTSGETIMSSPESPTIPTLISQRNIPEEQETTTFQPTKGFTAHPVTLTTLKFLTSANTPKETEGLPIPAKPPTTPEPLVEEIFKETKIEKKLETLPGNVLQKENLSLAADPLLIANTRLMDSEENVQLSSSEPKRLGAYIVIGLILLSFSSLVGYITFRKRMNRKRREFESNQESNDTEKALLSLSDYKDNADLEENHLKNNEITPIAKSNSQINKFEKNTNFSSPKNLNTTANEKNIEKDNVLKSTAENLTQVIIEDSPKDLEEDKNVPSMEKLIVKTRIDQDSIPKKPIIVNRSSTGYLPIPQDSS